MSTYVLWWSLTSQMRQMSPKVRICFVIRWLLSPVLKTECQRKESLLKALVLLSVVHDIQENALSIFHESVVENVKLFLVYLRRCKMNLERRMWDFAQEAETQKSLINFLFSGVHSDYSLHSVCNFTLLSCTIAFCLLVSVL